MVNYKLVGYLKEGHSQPLFGVQFNPFLPEKRIFATVGTNRVTVYQCVPDNQIVPIQCYTDADAEENFYACTWSLSDSGEVLLAVGGVKGIIRILSTDTMQCIITFTGHGNAVNELQIHPKDNNLF
ncbi:PREDICTED: polycomb protein eed-like [Amphimedon queenslandica]|uniref:Uncharacterized protein n=1 Tax=Amphimedon queenslandica TaxID=400682 RepID=A0AAN0JBF3_AMPQE|nr:PREDICTED: polycomb protein eed-like [Amphimedon queenslandica]|eukprot:XP_019854033.1 PREDICTED: polycomb protein eed-like [Amphimedon queenslandica]